MKKLLFAIAILFSGLSWANEEKSTSSSEPEVKSETVSKYIVGILKAGEALDADSLTQMEYLESHVAFLKKLNEQGKLFASGPLSTDPAFRGLYIFNVKSIAEAKMLMSQDASFSDGWINMEFHEWKTRDYKPEVGSGETVDETKEGGIKLTSNMIMVGVFGIIIFTLAIRTFRMKPTV